MSSHSILSSPLGARPEGGGSGGSKQEGRQLAELSPGCAAPTTGVFTTGNYRIYIETRPFMRDGATIYAWTTAKGATIYAWTSRAIHSFLGITVTPPWAASHGHVPMETTP